MSTSDPFQTVLKTMAVAVGLVNLPLEGYVIAKAWLWFAVPFGAPVIATVHGCALTITYALIAFRWEDRSEETGETMWKRAIAGLFVTLWTWGLLALVRWIGQS